MLWRADNVSIFQRLYDSEINFEVSCFWDGEFDVRLGDLPYQSGRSKTWLKIKIRRARRCSDFRRWFTVALLYKILSN
jgi:hypothetical protein